MTLLPIQRSDIWELSPFDHLQRVQGEINRLFELPSADPAQAGELFGVWAPALDLHEDEDNIVVMVEVPGVAKNDLKISLHEGVLTISGERRREKSAKEGANCRTERCFGKFHRAVHLHKPVKVEDVKANYKDGVLTVTMPKTEQAKPRQIAVIE
jgi:HSP20 family protein